MNNPKVPQVGTTNLKEFIECLEYWLTQTDSSYEIEVLSQSETHVKLRLFNAFDDNITIGNYAQPGLDVEWLGQYTENTYLVKVNSIVMQALGKHVAAWVEGYNQY